MTTRSAEASDFIHNSGLGRCKFPSKHGKNAYISFDAGLMNNLIDVIGAYAGPGFPCGYIQNLSGQSAYLSHRLLAFFVQDGDLVSCQQLSFGSWYAITGIIGSWDGSRKLPLWR